MFHRVFTVKSSNKLRSSDWRGLRSRLVTDYDALEPLLEASTGALRSITSITCEKLVFNNDNYLPSLYWATPPDPADLACVPILLAMEPLDGVILPSLTACWLAPGCVPIFVTCELVMEKLYQGADLMAPGILENVPDVEPNDIVGVALADEPCIVLALGIALLSGAHIRRCRQGKALRIIHYVGDRLWARCGKPKPPSSLEQATGKMSLAAESIDAPSYSAETNTAAPESSAPVPDYGPAPEYSEDEIVEALLMELPEVLLPITASSLQCKHLAVRLRGLDFRRTKWKSLSKFLRGMEKIRLLTTRERQGELLVASFDIQHSLFDDVVLAPKKKSAAPSTRKSSSAVPKNAPNAANRTKKLENSHSAPIVTVETVYRPTPHQAIVVGSAGRSHAVFTAAQVEAALREYAERKGFLKPSVQEAQGDMLSLGDSAICSAFKYRQANNVNVAGGVSGPDGAERESTEIPFTRGLELLLGNMKRMHRTSARPEDTWPGDFQPIRVTTVTRQKRRTITVVSNLAPFASLERQQQEFSVSCASSVSIDGDKLMVQGSQTKVLQRWVADNGLAQYAVFEE